MKTQQQEQEYKQYIKDSQIIKDAYNDAVAYVRKSEKKNSLPQIKMSTVTKTSSNT